MYLRRWNEPREMNIRKNEMKRRAPEKRDDEMKCER